MQGTMLHVVCRWYRNSKPVALLGNCVFYGLMFATGSPAVFVRAIVALYSAERQHESVNHSFELPGPTARARSLRDVRYLKWVGDASRNSELILSHQIPSESALRTIDWTLDTGNPQRCRRW